MQHPWHPALIAVIILAVATSPLLAQTKAPPPEIESRIKAITLHTGGGATVVRESVTPVPSGITRFILPGLPAHTYAQAIEGLYLSGQGLKARSVRPKQRFLDKPTREVVAQLENALEAAKKLVRQIEARVAGNQLALDYLESFRQRPSDPSPETFAFLQSESAKIFESRTRLALELANAQKDVEQLEARIRYAGASEARQTDLEVILNAPLAEAGSVSVAYHVEDAGWRQESEAFLDTDKEQLVIRTTAYLYQESGEDWPLANVTLGGSRASARTFPFSLESRFVGLSDPGLRVHSRQARLSAESDTQSLEELVVTGSRGIQTRFEQRFTLALEGSLPGDGEETRAPLATLTHDVSTVARSVMGRMAALEVMVAPPPDALFMPPQTVTLIRDGHRLGDARWPAVLPGQTTALAFGTLPELTVRRVPLGGKAGDTGLFGNQRRDETAWRYEVTNPYASPITVEILDTMPVSRNEDLRISAVDTASAPTDRAYGGRPGVYLWRKSLAEQETWRFVHGYRSRYPSNKVVTPAPE